MSESAELILRRSARRNFWLNVGDGAAFTFGASLVSRFTVLPAIIERLTDERWVQGVLPAVFFAGWLLPGLFIAPAVTAQPRRKPWVLVATLFERLPFFVLGIIMLALPALAPTPLLVTLFALYAVFALGAGFTSIAWQDLIARIIPDKQWGIFFGLQAGIGGVFGIGGGAIAAWVLETQPFPQSAGILMLGAAALMSFSYVLLALSVEPPQPTKPAQPVIEFLKSLGPLLRADAAFRSYLLSRATIALSLVGQSFLMAAALERFNSPPFEVGLFTATLLGAQAVGNFALGALADRWGHKQVLALSGLMTVASLLLAVLVPSSIWFTAIFALVGAAQAGYQLAGYTLTFSFSPIALRPTYIGVANLAMAPVSALGPLVAGATASLFGYNSIFFVLSIIGIVGILLLHFRVHVPTRAELEARDPA
jgi:MFS family permease